MRPFYSISNVLRSSRLESQYRAIRRPLSSRGHDRMVRPSAGRIYPFLHSCRWRQATMPPTVFIRFFPNNALSFVLAHYGMPHACIIFDDRTLLCYSLLLRHQGIDRLFRPSKCRYWTYFMAHSYTFIFSVFCDWCVKLHSKGSFRWDLEAWWGNFVFDPLSVRLQLKLVTLLIHMYVSYCKWKAWNRGLLSW